LDPKVKSHHSGAEPRRSGPGSTGHSLPSPAPRHVPAERLRSHKKAWCCVLFWLIIGVIFIPLALQFTSRLQSTLSGMKDAPSEIVRQNVVKNFSTALAFPTALVWDAKGLPADQADAAWSAALAALHADANVNDVTDGEVMVDKWPRGDWHAAFVAVNATTYGDAQRIIPELRADMAKLSFPGGKRPWVTGGPALFLDLNIASTEALRGGEMVALPITFIILLFVFRSPLAALLPVLVAILGVVCTLGALSCFASPSWMVPAKMVMPITFFVPNLVTMIGLGVGIDYCLIYLARYRRERARHLTTQEALDFTRKTAGKTVLASAVLVMSGFLTLFFIPLDFFTSIAVGGVLVVAAVALATLTLLPAMIIIVGPRLEWGSTFLRPLRSSTAGPRFYEWWAHLVVRRPWHCIVVGVVILVALGVPAFRLHIASVEAKNIPPASDSRQGYESLSRNLGSGWMMPAIILVQHPAAEWMGAEGLAQEKALVDQLGRLPNSQKIISVTDNSGPRRAQQTRMGLLTSFNDPTQSVILMLSQADPQSPTARIWLDRISAVLKGAQKADPKGPRYYLGGLPSVTLSADRVVIGSLPTVILITLCSTFVLLLIFMRSLLVALKAIVLNLLCVMAAYGFQVLCFQDGWGSLLFHFPQTDGLNTVVLVICFCALFGLSMDYEVFILSAVRESWLDQHNMRLAVQDGLMRVGGIITSAAVIMISVFLSFGFVDVVEIEQLGVGLSFAILLDATIIRLLLVPAVMLIMGRWAFWCPGQRAPPARTPLHQRKVESPLRRPLSALIRVGGEKPQQ
jgi:RND superfamily putative drug exporter